MEKYGAAIGSFVVSVIVFAFGYGRMNSQVTDSTKEIAKTRRLVDDHIAKTDIHIDPIRDRESQRLVVERLTKVETSLDNLRGEVRNEARSAGERQAVLLQEVRAALNATKNN